MLGLNPAFVEKDFWVTELLRSIAVPLGPDGSGPREVVPVFKGGTSLSKVYRLIDRFSEDVDVLLVCGADLGAGRRDRALRDICDRAGTDLGIPDADCKPAGSTTGVKRNVRFVYPRSYESPAITPGVLLEMGIRGGPEPRTDHAVRSMVADHAIDSLKESPDVWAEFAPVEIAVLGAERTLIEKLSLLHGLCGRLEQDPAALARAGRHFYDVHQLLGDPEVRDRLAAYDGGTMSLAADIYHHSMLSGFPACERPAAGYATSPVFTLGSAAEPAARAAYEEAAVLVWGSRPSFDDCIGVVQTYAALL
jgi:hypothetical protein